MDQDEVIAPDRFAEERHAVVAADKDGAAEGAGAHLVGGVFLAEPVVGPAGAAARQLFGAAEEAFGESEAVLVRDIVERGLEGSGGGGSADAAKGAGGGLGDVGIGVVEVFGEEFDGAGSLRTPMLRMTPTSWRPVRVRSDSRKASSTSGRATVPGRSGPCARAPRRAAARPAVQRRDGCQSRRVGGRPPFCHGARRWT
jgi:hypothetical protein